MTSSPSESAPEPRATGPGTTPATSALTRWVAMAAGLALLAVIAGTGLGLALRSSLPDEVASHYGSDGVDGTQPLTGYLVTAGMVLVVLTVILALVAAVVPADGRRILGAIHAWVVGLIATVMYGSLVGQRGLADARQAPNPGRWLAIGALLGAVLAVPIWRALRPAAPPPPPPAHRDPLPDGAPRLAAGASERLAWLGRTPWASGAVIVVALTSVLTVVLAVAVDPWVAVIPAVTTVGVAGMLQARVSIDAAGLRVRSFGRLTWIVLPVEQVRSATVEEISPLRDFGGFGLRYRPHGRGFVTRGGRALRVDTYDDTSTWVTIEDAEQAAAVLNTLVSRLDR